MVPGSIEELEERLIACHELWWRTPGEGRWPFAGDGPWHLIQGEAGDYAGVGSDGAEEYETRSGRRIELKLRVVDSAAPRVPLSRAEVSARDRVTAWLELLPDPFDRALVWRASMRPGRAQVRPSWKRIGGELGWRGSENGLKWRWRKAMAALVCALNGWGAAVGRRMAGGEVREITH